MNRKESLLSITGKVDQPHSYSLVELQSISTDYQVPDVSKIDQRRKGSAVRLNRLLELAHRHANSDRLLIKASSDDYSSSVPLKPVAERGLLIYQIDGRPLTAAEGGPIRLFIPDSDACGASEVDACANVKFVDTIEVLVSDEG